MEIKLKKGRNQFKALFHSTEEGIALHEMKYDESGNPTDCDKGCESELSKDT